MSALAKEDPRPSPVSEALVLPVRRIGRIDIAAVDGRRIVAILAERLERLRFTRLAFANAHCVNVAADDAGYGEGLRGFVVLADGIGVDIASKLLYGAPFPENLNGTDFVPRLLGALTGPRRIALIGAAPGTVEAAARALRQSFPQHEFRAVSHGFFREGLETEIVLARLRDFSPDITLFGFGVPSQEVFIARHLTIRETTLAIGVGALLDFLAGNVERAPAGWRRLRLEWLYRLLREPSRLWRRYVLGNPRFLLRVFADRLVGGRRREGEAMVDDAGQESGQRRQGAPLAAAG